MVNELLLLFKMGLLVLSQWLNVINVSTTQFFHNIFRLIYIALWARFIDKILRIYFSIALWTYIWALFYLQDWREIKLVTF